MAFSFGAAASSAASTGGGFSFGGAGASSAAASKPAFGGFGAAPAASSAASTGGGFSFGGAAPPAATRAWIFGAAAASTGAAAAAPAFGAPAAGGFGAAKPAFGAPAGGAFGAPARPRSVPPSLPPSSCLLSSLSSWPPSDHGPDVHTSAVCPMAVACCACGVIRSLSRRRGRVRCGCLHRRSIRGAGDQRRLRRLWQAGDWRRVWRPRCRWLWGNRRRLWRQASFRSGGHRWCVRCACGRWLRRPRRGGVRGSVYRRRVRRQHGWGFWSAGRRRGWRCPVRDGDPVSGHAARAVSASARCADRAGQHPGWDG